MKESKAVSEGVLLAFVSALSYAVAYAYRAGYASHYSLPPLMLSPDIGDVLRAAAAVGFTLVLVWNVAHVVWPMVPPPTTALARSVRSVVLFSLVTAVIAFSAVEYSSAWIVTAIFTGIFAFLEFVTPLSTNRKVAGYENKLLAQEEIERAYHRSTPTQHLANLLGEDGVRLIWVGVALVLIGGAKGSKDARTEENYYAVESHPGYVVASFHEGSAILVKYDQKSFKLVPEFVLVPLSGETAIRKMHVGKLEKAIENGA